MIANRCPERVPSFCRKVSLSGHFSKMHEHNSHKFQFRNIVLSQLQTYIEKIPFSQILDSSFKKEISNLLSKAQNITNRTYLWKDFIALSSKTSNHAKTKNDSQTEESAKQKPSPEIVTKWKEELLHIDKETLTSKIHHILLLISNSSTSDSKISRVTQLNKQLMRTSQAQHIAVKGGAVRLLLKLRRENGNNEELAKLIRESLALLGYVNPVSGKGIRILAIDGGGIRGILVIEMLKKLEELTGKRVHEMFDLVCGVSTGAIIASLIGGKQLSLDEILDIYKNLSVQIFTQSAFKGTSNLVWSHSYYDTALWEKLLKEQIGNQLLISTTQNSQCPKLCILSAVVNQRRLSAYVFRNYNLPCQVQSQYLGGHNHHLWEAVRASAAAPTYFEEFKLDNMLHQDGGILFNNPTAAAIHEAKLLWPGVSIQNVLSFGTGRIVPFPPESTCQKNTTAGSSWKDKFYAIIESATDTEGVHTILSDLLPNNVYYRFNPYLTEMFDMAETDSIKLEQLRRDAVMYLRRNEDKFQEVANSLKIEKTSIQQAVDWLKLQQTVIF